MTRKKTPRSNFIETADLKKVAAWVWNAMQLASTHDPDLLRRIEVLERQMQRIKAPQYRRVR